MEDLRAADERPAMDRVHRLLTTGHGEVVRSTWTGTSPPTMRCDPETRTSIWPNCAVCTRFRSLSGGAARELVERLCVDALVGDAERRESHTLGFCGGESRMAELPPRTALVAGPVCYHNPAAGETGRGFRLFPVRVFY